MPWEPTSLIVENWGRLQLIVGGQDVTFFRGVPAQIKNWSINEPFDHAVMTVGFPQITPFEPLPSWLHDYALVDLNLIRPDGSAKRLWEGLFIDESDSLNDQGNELLIEFLGALYQGDFYRMQPDITKPGARDITLIIGEQLSPSTRPHLKTLPVLTYGYTGVVYGQQGSWQPLLSGYIQDILSVATSSGLPMPGEAMTGITMHPSGQGYWLTGSLGSVLAFGEARYWGSMLGTSLTEPGNRIAAHPNGTGYWFNGTDGGVFSFGENVAFHGSLGLGGNPNDVIAIESHPSGQGYWLLDNIGGIFTFGAAPYVGGIPGQPPDPELVSGDYIYTGAPTSNGQGYILFSDEGRVYSFGNAPHYGNSNMVSVFGAALASDDSGYWLLKADGEVQYFGTPYRHFGDRSAEADGTYFRNIEPTPTNNGYYLIGQNGSVYTFGDAVYQGAITEAGAPDLIPGDAIYDAALTASGNGYWMMSEQGYIYAFGDAPYHGGPNGTGEWWCFAPHPDDEGYWLCSGDGSVAYYGAPYRHYGDLGGTHPNWIYDIKATPSGEGYWLYAEDGGVFAFGDAGFFGSIPDPVYDPAMLIPGDRAVDFGRTSSGNGYSILTRQGYLYTFGDAAYHGAGSGNRSDYCAIAMHPGDQGYWLLTEDGTVYAYNVPHYGDHGAQAENVKFSDIVASPSGNGYALLGEDGGIFTYGDAPFFGSVPGGGGWVSQWTIMNHGDRRPVLKVKNTWDTHWTVRIGTPGVNHEFSRDLSTAANVYYGEGIDLDNCRWRNTKYPNLREDSPPVFSGVELTIGSTHPDVYTWKREMYDAGWTGMSDMDTIAAGRFSKNDSNLCRYFQGLAGLTQTGTVNAQTWAATFNQGVNAGDLSSPFYAPLAIANNVEMFQYSPRGGIIGLNPGFDSGATRIESYSNYGARVSKWEGIYSSNGMLERDFPAPYSGTIRLSTDPLEGSRFEMKAGQNIKVLGHRGVDRLFHIATVDVDWQSGTVTLQVDQGARDALTLAAFRSRYRDLTDPTKRMSSRRAQSMVIPDQRPEWDCENGGGIIQRHAVNGGLWNVLRVPAGEVGTVVRSDFKVDIPARFVVAVFERPIAPNDLHRLGSPLEEGFWDNFANANDPEGGGEGLAIAWGNEGQAGGFWPGLESDGDPLTGRMVDDAGWYYESSQPPWLWVAVWVESPGVNWIQGHFQSAPSDA